MSLGLVGSSSTFQRLINSLFSGPLGNTLFSYLDDIVFSKDVLEHFQKLEKVLSCLAESGLKLKLSKCHFLQKETKFLGHVIDANGIHTSQDKIQTILDYSVILMLMKFKEFLV